MNIIKKKLWQWPNGLVWRITEGFTLKSRKKKFELFMSIIKPKPDEAILDVGVSPFVGRSTNFLELWYPYPENITAATNANPDTFNDFNRHFPKVKLKFSDGRNLNFEDNSFDIVFSNAVVEHVGGNDEQKGFIKELLRVSKRVFITTPNYWFPIDSHTLIPFVHYLPLKFRFWLYKKLGRKYYANLNHLNLLTAGEFLSLFPKQTKVKLYKQKIFGMVSTLIAVVEKYT